jgi:hypothetical protein
MSEIKPIAWLVGNDSVGPHALRHTDPKGWKYSAGLMKISDHKAEVARLRAEVEEYRKDAERYRWIRSPFATSIESLIGMHCSGELDYQIDKAMGDPA